MAYRNPAFSFLHAATLAGVTLSSSVAEAAGFPLARVADYRIAQPFRFGSSSTDPWVKVDRGAGTLEAIDRVYLPPASNGSDLTVTVATSATDSGYTNRGSAVWTDGEALVLDLTSSSERWVRITLTGTGAFDLPEVFLTRRREPNRGTDTKWDATPEYPAQIIRLGGGSAGFATGEKRRRWGYRAQFLSGADLDVFRELLDVTHGGVFPFLLDPPDTLDGAAVFVEIESLRKVEQDRERPAALGPEYTVEFDMIEVTL